MDVTILHLYHDILNLYGESGNVKALAHNLRQQSLNVTVTEASIEDELPIRDADIIYIGSGTEDNQAIAAAHLMPYKSAIEESIDNGTFILATGNAMELFGKGLTRSKENGGTFTPFLGIFDYESFEAPHRMSDDVLFTTGEDKLKVLGFQNQRTETRGIENYAFEVVRGIGSYRGSRGEGFACSNFLGTYIIGPLLIRNPYILKSYIERICRKLDPDFDIKPMDLEYEISAYDTYMEGHYKKG